MTASDLPGTARASLAAQLRRSRASAGLAAVVRDLPFELAGRRVDGHPHTAWQLVEHLRLAAVDLVEYCLDPDYRELGWPDGYWPDEAAPASAEAWRETIDALLDATERMARLVEDEANELLVAVPTAEKPDHHAFRAALILLDHNSNHAGQLIGLRRALGIWPPAG